MSALTHIREKVFRAKQSEFAEIAGTTQGTVSRWESGELKPTLDQLVRIRDEAKRRGLMWKDDWFFDAEAIPHDAAESAA